MWPIEILFKHPCRNVIRRASEVAVWIQIIWVICVTCRLTFRDETAHNLRGRGTFSYEYNQLSTIFWELYNLFFTAFIRYKSDFRPVKALAPNWTRFRNLDQNLILVFITFRQHDLPTKKEVTLKITRFFNFLYRIKFFCVYLQVFLLCKCSFSHMFNYNQ